ncbi:hypothetical protein BC831DRAFT_506914 [Entophlyctis helioformis]|nr:hypothetical protein BC831DRAFT_506914 [Entophlyctis helioformis]
MPLSPALLAALLLAIARTPHAAAQDSAPSTAASALVATADPTYILVPVNPPACWYRPAFARGQLSDVDLLANSYDMVVPVREPGDASGAQVPGGVPVGPSPPAPSPPAPAPAPSPSIVSTTNGTTVVIVAQPPAPMAPAAVPLASTIGPLWCTPTNGSFSYYQFDVTKRNLLRYDGCADANCLAGCVLADTVAFPPAVAASPDAVGCSPSFYQLANMTSLSPLNATGSYSSFLRADFFTKTSDTVNCTGPVKRSNLVKVYDTCTRISPAGLPLSYALTVFSGTQATQRLCQDSGCLNCVTSTAFSPWTLSNTCGSAGTSLSTRGLYMGNATATTSVPATNDGQGFTLTVAALAGFVAGAVVLFALLVLLGWWLLNRNQRTYDDQRALEIATTAAAMAARRTKDVEATPVSSSLPRLLPGSTAGLMGGPDAAHPRTSSIGTTRRVSMGSPMMGGAMQLPPSGSSGSATAGDASRGSLQSSDLAAAAGAGVGVGVAGAGGAGSGSAGVGLGAMGTPGFNASQVVHIMEQAHTVVVDYEPQMTDELRLTVGDQVILESVWSDGWAQAYNISTGERGTLALATLYR